MTIDLEVESLEGTFSSNLVSNKSAANGKPALADIVDRTPAENPEPPSAYCEVHINDRLIYRTRTKQMTPLPYFNAVSERFLRDWRLAKVTIVVRDERDREHGGSLTVYRADSRSNSWYRGTQSEGAFPEYKSIHPVVPPCWRSGLGSNSDIATLETY